jgi:hypothetical protein
MPLPGRSVSAGTLVPNYGVTNLAPNSPRRGDRISVSWNEYKFGHGSHRGLEIKNDCADEAQQKFTGPGLRK